MSSADHLLVVGGPLDGGRLPCRDGINTFVFALGRVISITTSDDISTPQIDHVEYGRVTITGRDCKARVWAPVEWTDKQVLDQLLLGYAGSAQI